MKNESAERKPERKKKEIIFVEHTQTNDWISKYVPVRQ